MENNAVFLKLKEVMISTFDLAADSITPDKKLEDDLELDSLDMVDLILVLSDVLGEKLDPPLFNNAVTVKDVVDLISPFWKTK